MFYECVQRAGHISSAVHQANAGLGIISATVFVTAATVAMNQTAVSLNTAIKLCVIDNKYTNARVGKGVDSTSSYHSRQCGIVHKLCSDRIVYTVVCFVTHDCSGKYCLRIDYQFE